MKESRIVKFLEKEEDKNFLFERGVYRISFGNGCNKSYIGSTTESFDIRLKRHLYDLKRDKHCNIMLGKAYKKYGNPLFSIIEICDKNKCLEREQYWIDSLQPEYNICKVAGNTLGVKPSKETLEKMSTKVDVFDLHGNFVNTFQSISEAAKITKADSTTICKVIRDEIGTSGKFMFRKHGLYQKLEPYSKTTSRSVLCYKKTGEFIRKYDSLLEAGKDLGINHGNISRSMSNDTFCYDFIFKKFEENYPTLIDAKNRVHKYQKLVTITNILTGEVVEYSSIRSIPEEIIARTTINKKLKDSDSFIFKKKFKIQVKSARNNELALI